MTHVELEVADSFERIFPVPVVVEDWDGVLARAGAERRRRGPTFSTRRLVALAGVVLVGALLVTPALGIGDRLLDLIQDKRKPLDVQAPAWSPDGRTIVFVSWRDGNGEVYVMDAEGGKHRNLTLNPAKDVRPTWSPNGRRIAFVSSRDGQSEIYVMNADGTKPRNMTRARANDDYPVWSHDGRRLAFLRARLHSRTVRGVGVHSFTSYSLYVVDADGSNLRRLTRAPTFRYQLVWSPDGQTIYFGRLIVRVDGTKTRRLAHIPLTAVWSPDGRRIAFVRTLRRATGQIYNVDVYVMNADGSGYRRLTDSPGYDGEPVWSPDGRRIAFRSSRDGNGEIYVMNADGSEQRNLTRHAARDSRPSWSPDGKKLAFISNRDGDPEAYVMNANGSGQRRLTARDA